MSGRRLAGRWLLAFTAVFIVGSLANTGSVARLLMDMLTLGALALIVWAVSGTVFAVRVRRARQR